MTKTEIRSILNDSKLGVNAKVHILYDAMNRKAYRLFQLGILYCNLCDYWDNSMVSMYPEERVDRVIIKIEKRIKRSHGQIRTKLADDKANPKRLFAYINSKKSTRGPISRLRCSSEVVITEANKLSEFIRVGFRRRGCVSHARAISSNQP